MFGMPVCTRKMQKLWVLCFNIILQYKTCHINLTTRKLSKNNYPNKIHTFKEYLTIIDLLVPMLCIWKHHQCLCFFLASMFQWWTIFQILHAVLSYNQYKYLAISLVSKCCCFCNIYFGPSGAVQTVSDSRRPLF